MSDNDPDFDSDDDIVGEAVYDEAYLKKRKQRRKHSSSSEGDEEYQWDDDNVEDEEDDDDEDDESISMSEDSDKPRKVKQQPGRTRRETKSRSVGEIQSGLRRSKRATRNRIDYRKCEASDSEREFIEPEKSNASDDHSDASVSESGEYMVENEDSDSDDDQEQEMKVDEPVTYPAVEENEEKQPPEKSNSPVQDEIEGTGKRRFLDLNELAPSPGFDDGPNTIMKDEDNDY